jgi:hypothetical protein
MSRRRVPKGPDIDWVVAGDTVDDSGGGEHFSTEVEAPSAGAAVEAAMFKLRISRVEEVRVVPKWRAAEKKREFRRHLRKFKEWQRRRHQA